MTVLVAETIIGLMRLVIQRVQEARVEAEGRLIAEIPKGLSIFVGVDKTDTEEDIDYLVDKVLHLRIFEDDLGKMNLSVEDVQGALLVVSQFTLLGDCRKGRRPSFDEAADAQKGEELYNHFVDQLKGRGLKVATGQFKAKMAVSLVNDGPVTFVLESKK